MKEQESKNKLGTMPVNKLMLNMGIPMILSMMLQAVYNIVDSAFVGNMPGEGVGDAALNALTLAFPVQMLMVAIGIGTGVGMNALLSKYLGQGEQEKASKTAGNAMFLGGIISIVFLLFGLFGVEPYVASQTENQAILHMAVEYLQICCVASFGIVFFSIFEKLLQATGRSVLSTAAQITGAIVNIVLDPILIYGWCGLPTMGVQGAAYATVIGQIISFLLAFFFHLQHNKDIKNGIVYMKPAASVIKGIYVIGLPAIIAQALMSVMTYGLNIILGTVSEAAVTAYGLYYKIQQFVLFAAFGLRDAITPIVSFNYGMKDKKRIQDGIKYGMGYTLGIMVVGLLVLEAFAGPFSQIFGLSGETRELCVGAMRIVSLSFLFAGANIAFQGFFQALEGGIETLVVSVCRQFLFVLPVAWGFSLIAKENLNMLWLVWTTFLIAEGLTVILAGLFMHRIYKNKIKKLEI